MKTGQKLAKIIALGFATLLAVGIISMIVFSSCVAFRFVGYLVGGAGETSGNVTYSEEFSGVRSVNINMDVGQILIQSGKTFKVETREASGRINANADGGVLTVSLKDQGFLAFMGGSDQLVITIPKDAKLDDFYVKLGLGHISLNEITVEKLTADLGVGYIEGLDLAVADTAKIKLGIGKVGVTDSTFYNARLENGIGLVKFEGELHQNNSAEIGIGSVQLFLTDDKQEYRFDINTGLGGSNISSGGSGENAVMLKSGIGGITVTFF